MVVVGDYCIIKVLMGALSLSLESSLGTKQRIRSLPVKGNTTGMTIHATCVA